MTHSVIVPKLNNNDDACELREWLVTPGAAVESGAPLAILVTSKATFELTAEHDGYIHLLADAGAQVDFGAEIARLFPTEAELAAFGAERERERASRATDGSDDRGPVITKAARDAMDKHGVSMVAVRALGKSVVRATDVEMLVDGSPPADVRPASVPPPTAGFDADSLSPRQRAIAKVVAASHAQIPAAFLQMRVWTQSADAGLKHLSRKHRRMIGLPELLVHVIAELAAEHKAFYLPARSDPSTLADPNIGITLDVGEGLFIPVIKKARSKSLPELAAAMDTFREKAWSDSFTADDLTDGHISISLNRTTDVVCVVPIVLPGQTCMLSLTASSEELRLDEAGKPVMRPYVNLGVVYDHRYINGGAAMHFLGAVKLAIEEFAPAG
jgi:2-oxoglutarate dehydrogenase E2 component (dihydrolipoamide succinyltransferase)